jgi:hypothetical protein
MPGFVRVDDAHTLTTPDFSGNRFFNTLGNLQLDPRAGLLFVDFDSGDLLYVAADAEIVWDGPLVASFDGAQRVVRFRVREVRRTRRVLPLRWSPVERAPQFAAATRAPAATASQTAASHVPTPASAAPSASGWRAARREDRRRSARDPLVSFRRGGRRRAARIRSRSASDAARRTAAAMRRRSAATRCRMRPAPPITGSP